MKFLIKAISLTDRNKTKLVEIQKQLKNLQCNSCDVIKIPLTRVGDSSGLSVHTLLMTVIANITCVLNHVFVRPTKNEDEQPVLERKTAGKHSGDTNSPVGAGAGKKRVGGRKYPVPLLKYDRDTPLAMAHGLVFDNGIEVHNMSQAQLRYALDRVRSEWCNIPPSHI